MLIDGMHVMLWSDKTNELRAFLRDVLEFPAIESGGGWMKFRHIETEMGCHERSDVEQQNTPSVELSFFCHNLDQTVTSLKKKGVILLTDIVPAGHGRTINFQAPGGFRFELYEPRMSPES
ncbi:MAG: VOC family protein [Pseudomonadota bacterium]